MSIDEQAERFIRSGETERSSLRRLTLMIGMAVSLMLLIATLQFATLQSIASDAKQISADNRRVLTSQIPGLEDQIATQRRVIEDQQNVLSQAVSAIGKLAKQVKDLGGDPGQIILQPPKHDPQS